MADTTDVAIIGGGAAGCAVAYYLAKSGVKSTIIERQGLGNQASGESMGKVCARRATARHRDMTVVRNPSDHLERFQRTLHYPSM